MAAPTIVVIDDESQIRDYLEEVLSLDGYECRCFQEGLSALAYMSQNPPDLVMTDIRMPGMNGLELLKQVHSQAPTVPVILISGLYELAIALEAVRGGAADFLLKPAKPAEVLSLVAKHLHHGSGAAPEALQAALADFITRFRQGSADAGPLFQLLGFKRYETMQHSLRVAAYAVRFGQACGLERAQMLDLELGALLHDVGKIAIPSNVLMKPGPLDEREWEIMRSHPRIGYQLLADLPGMEDAAQIVYSHHERYDGAGYPRGLRGEEIPLGARLFSIVDTVDAITCDRPYRAAQPFSVACRELGQNRGSQFDPGLVETFLQVPEQDLVTIRTRLPDSE